jgi:hypothetical protein
MKRILKISCYAFFVCLLAFPALSAQEIKTEKNIKVILVDDSGKKTVIDTLIKDGTMSGTIKISDGKVFVIDDNTSGSDNKTKGGTEHITVTVTSDEDDSRIINKEVIVVSSDSMNWQDSEESENIYVFNSTAPHTKEQDMIRPRDSEESKQDFEKTKYIIKRDGMVISVEGDDYNKVKEIVEEIESTLESKNSVTEKDPVAPADPKKDGKKK